METFQVGMIIALAIGYSWAVYKLILYKDKYRHEKAKHGLTMYYYQKAAKEKNPERLDIVQELEKSNKLQIADTFESNGNIHIYFGPKSWDYQKILDKGYSVIWENGLPREEINSLFIDVFLDSANDYIKLLDENVKYVGKKTSKQ